MSQVDSQKDKEELNGKRHDVKFKEKISFEQMVYSQNRMILKKMSSCFDSDSKENLLSLKSAMDGLDCLLFAKISVKDFGFDKNQYLQKRLSLRDDLNNLTLNLGNYANRVLFYNLLREYYEIISFELVNLKPNNAIYLKMGE